MAKPARPKKDRATDPETDPAPRPKMTKTTKMTKMTKMTRAEKTLRALALGYPETVEEFPWGERVIKVRRKVFLFMGHGHGEGHAEWIDESYRAVAPKSLVAQLPARRAAAPKPSQPRRRRPLRERRS
jgi:hypothetical protein